MGLRSRVSSGSGRRARAVLFRLLPIVAVVESNQMVLGRCLEP